MILVIVEIGDEVMAHESNCLHLRKGKALREAVTGGNRPKNYPNMDAAARDYFKAQIEAGEIKGKEAIQYIDWANCTNRLREFPPKPVELLEQEIATMTRRRNQILDSIKHQSQRLAGDLIRAVRTMEQAESAERKNNAPFGRPHYVNGAGIVQDAGRRIDMDVARFSAIDSQLESLEAIRRQYP